MTIARHVTSPPRGACHGRRQNQRQRLPVPPLAAAVVRSVCVAAQSPGLVAAALDELGTRLARGLTIGADYNGMGSMRGDDISTTRSREEIGIARLAGMPL
jgi:hypothetical protein